MQQLVNSDIYNCQASLVTVCVDEVQLGILLYII
jgi:hypothetical protein